MENKINQKKGGRPQRPNGLTVVVRIRMTQKDFEICKEKAQQANLPLSKFARIMLREGRVFNTFSKEIQGYLKILIGMSNNLNQLTRLSHTYSLTNLEQQVQEIAYHIKAIIDQYNIKNN